MTEPFNRTLLVPLIQKRRWTGKTMWHRLFHAYNATRHEINGAVAILFDGWSESEIAC